MAQNSYPLFFFTDRIPYIQDLYRSLLKVLYRSWRFSRRTKHNTEKYTAYNILSLRQYKLDRCNNSTDSTKQRNLFKM